MTTDSDSHDALPDLLPRLRAVVRRVAGPREVDDLVQECCVRLLEKEHQFRGGPGGFAAWAQAIARNLSVTFHTKNARSLEESMEHADRVSAPEPTLDEERVGWILDQLSRLDEDDRTCLKLRYFDGLTVEGVGRALGLSQAGASKRLERALGRLQSRAKRQGWLTALLPAPWAAGLAGTSPMKLTLAAAATAATATFAGSFFLPDPDTPVQGSSANLAHTDFAPAMATPLEPTENLLWCGSLQLAFDALVESAGQRFDPDASSPTAKAILADPFDGRFVDPASYVAVAGFEADALIEEAQRRLAERFGRGRDPLLDSLRGSGLPVAYAFLAKAMAFGIEFEDLADRPFAFGPSEVDVEAWGWSSYDPGSGQHDTLGRQVRCLHYGGPDDFVLEFLPETGDRIVLARLAPGPTLAATWAKVQARREAYATLDDETKARLAWDGGDRLWVPKLDFDLSHAFPPMDLGVDGLAGASVLQTLRVRLDHRGAELKSRVMILRGSVFQDPKQCVFDGSFLAAFVQGDAPLPYAAAWVADAELLVPREPEK